MPAMRFRLRTLLIAVSILAFASAAAGWSWRRNQAEQQAVKVLAGHRIGLGYTRGLPLGPLEKWFDARLGREFRSDVSSVHLHSFEADEPKVVAALRRLPGLKRVEVDAWPGSQATVAKLQSDFRDTPVEVKVEHVVW